MFERRLAECLLIVYVLLAFSPVCPHGCYFREGECGIEGVFCGIFVVERSANYTLEFFRIPQNSNKVKSST